MTRDAPFGLDRSMFVCERTLLIGVTLNTRSICAGCQPRLLELKATVRVVTITTLHCAFEDLVMEGLVKVRLYFIVTAKTQLRLSHFYQRGRCKTWLLRVHRSDKRV